MQLKLEVMEEEVVGGRPGMTGETATGRHLHPCKAGGQEREVRLGLWESRVGELHPNWLFDKDFLLVRPLRAA